MRGNAAALDAFYRRSGVKGGRAKKKRLKRAWVGLPDTHITVKGRRLTLKNFVTDKDKMPKGTKPYLPEETVSYRTMLFLNENFPGMVYRFDIAADLYLRPQQQVEVATRFRHKRGYPDLFIPRAKHGYNGLYIELKAFKKDVLKKNGDFKKSDHLAEQRDMLTELAGEGYYVSFAWGEDDHVFHTIAQYLID